jgi:rRNA-processing protein FCF1
MSNPAKSKLLVVDTCVLRAAGESGHPVASACREYLSAILRICHRTALSKALQKEWRRHMNSMSAKWLTSMFARRKIQWITPSPLKYDAHGLSKSDRAEVEKDCPLMEAALAADRIIVTNDKELDRILTKTAAGIRLREQFRWLYPQENGPKVLERLD